MKKILLVLVILTTIIFTSANKIEVYFNAPPQSAGIDVKLIELLDKAEFAIDAHFYQISNMDIVDAFVRAANRIGAKNVRLVTEEHYFEMDKYTDVFKPLLDAGITIVTDTAGDGIDRGQCHNKFCVIDDKYVWMGSYNITENGTYKNNNNALKFESPVMANIFRQEFKQEFYEKKFSIKKTAHDHPEVWLGGTKIKTYFSPKQNAKAAILNEINNADESIYFAIFTFTDNDIKQAIINKMRQGVKVYGVFDSFQAHSTYSAYNDMKDIGAKVKKDTNKGLLHHKFMVIDPDTNSDPTVITGSYNWTSAAGKVNDESTVVIKDNNEIAMKYYYEVAKLYGDGFDEEGGGVVIPDDDIKRPKLIISEVCFNDPNGDWIEIYCIDDQNNGNGFDIGGYYLEDDGLIKLFKDGTIVKTGDFIIVAEGWWQDDTDAGYDKKLYTFVDKIGLVSTDEQVILKEKGSGVILDAVCWSDHDGSFSPGEEEDLRDIYWAKQWNSPNERECVDSSCVPPGNITIVRKYKSGDFFSNTYEFYDTNSLNDWFISDEPTPGKLR